MLAKRFLYNKVTSNSQIDHAEENVTSHGTAALLMRARLERPWVYDARILLVEQQARDLS